MFLLCPLWPSSIHIEYFTSFQISKIFLLACVCVSLCYQMLWNFDIFQVILSMNSLIRNKLENLVSWQHSSVIFQCRCVVTEGSLCDTRLLWIVWIIDIFNNAVCMTYSITSTISLTYEMRQVVIVCHDLIGSNTPFLLLHNLYCCTVVLIAFTNQ